MKLNKVIFSMMLVGLLFVILPNIVRAESIKINLDKWLISDPITVNMPVSNNELSINGVPYAEKDLLQFKHLSLHIRPNEGDLFTPTNSKWELADCKNSLVEFGTKEESDTYKVSYLVSYIEANRWLKAKLNIETSALIEVFVNGKAVGGVYNLQDGKGIFSSQLDFEKQNYALIIKVLHKNEASIKASIEFEEKYEADALSLKTNSGHFMDIDHVLLGSKIKDIKVSANGNYYIAEYSEITKPEGKVKRWFEIYELKSKKLIQSVKGVSFDELQWLPVGNSYSYVNEKSVWVYDLDHGSLKPYLADIGASNIVWAGDASFMIYSLSENAPNKNELAHKLENMQDRWPWYRSRAFLYKYNLNTKVSQRLTFGNLSTTFHDISPDNKRILYSEEEIDNANRPYSKQYMYELNLQSMTLDTLWVKNFGGDVNYSPDGKNILVTGSPIMFGDKGLNLKRQKIANDYDSQAYIFNLSTKAVKAISKKFNPTINSVHWVSNETIYFTTTDRSYRNLYKYNVKTGRYQLVEQPLDIMSSIYFAENVPIAGVVANGISSRDQGFILNLKTGSFEKVIDSEKEFFKDVQLGETKDWTYKTKKGVKIDGFVYYPPNFDKSKKYPLIVYYYAGTSPIDRNFRGRYPKHLYAAHGYVVYVLNPSGTVGYGQEYSAAHVNNWGITVADEIIKATKAFTKSHTYVDAQNIGCMGASYGGFTTMLLMTRTDLFATAISHAGISSISSYWGEGYWGYLYSATATANSFPWNNRQVYVEQSPLFNADKVVNPMLLLHGSKDTNVPIGESLQMYAALRLLGKPVEMVQILGQDHTILEYKRRVFWQKTIAAWFDKHLKDEPEWWKALYPDTNLE